MNSRRFIVTNKDVISAEFDKSLQIPMPINFTFEGDAIIGKRQLVHIIEYEATQRIKEKYLSKEIEEILNEVVLVKPTKKSLKLIMKHVKFIEPRKSEGV